MPEAIVRGSEAHPFACCIVVVGHFLAGPLRDGKATLTNLHRELPARLTQRLQVLIQDRIIRRVLAGRKRLSLPLPLRLLRRFPILRRIPLGSSAWGSVPSTCVRRSRESRSWRTKWFSPLSPKGRGAFCPPAFTYSPSGSRECPRCAPCGRGLRRPAVCRRG